MSAHITKETRSSCGHDDYECLAPLSLHRHLSQEQAHSGIFRGLGHKGVKVCHTWPFGAFSILVQVRQSLDTQVLPVTSDFERSCALPCEATVPIPWRTPTRSPRMSGEARVLDVR